MRRQQVQDRLRFDASLRMRTWVHNFILLCIGIGSVEERESSESKKTIIYSLLTSARKANVENWKMWHQNANVENAGLENAKKENMGHRKLLKVSHV